MRQVVRTGPRRFRSVGGCVVINHYGPTETTVGVLTYPVDDEDDQTQSGTVPIGRPLPNTQVYVLDDRLRPVPIGVAGELYIGGTLVTRGYLNLPELTAANFVPDPFSLLPDRRLYRTGDIVRWLPKGKVEFIGSRDNQVKIRGYRVELGEIEAVLWKQPSVTGVAVIVCEAGSIQRLVAYVSLDDPASIENLMEHSRQALPSHMVPSDFVVLDHLPRTPHGKLDRKALPVPDGRLNMADRVRPAPQPGGRATVWHLAAGDGAGSGRRAGQLLPPGRSFAVGHAGDQPRAWGISQVELPVAALFTGPTVAELSVSLQRQWLAGSAVGVLASGASGT